jgi:2-polyprenyl-6-methoxyphenol hydroxylase-like FAD-dependent oxidoreductase
VKHVIIAGAGLGGLTLANALLQQRPRKLRVTVLERDTHPEARPQGYSLGLTHKGGLGVLNKLGLGEEMERTGRRTSCFHVLTPGGSRLLSLKMQPGDDYDQLAVPRAALRSILLSPLPEGTVRWGARVRGYQQSGAKVWALLDGGEELEGDLLVAADGVNSPVRQQMLVGEPKPLGLSAIGGVSSAPPQHSLLDGGTFMTLGRGTSIFVQRFAEKRVLWSFCTHATPGTLAVLGAEAQKSLALQETVGWHAPIQELIRSTPNEGLSVLDYFDRDPSSRAREGHVVLLGDAAHPMSPFQGQGANMAMFDAMKLAELLGGSEGLGEVLATFEREMLARTAREVLKSRKAAHQFHARGTLPRVMRDTALRIGNAMLMLAPGAAAPRAAQH